LLHRLLPLGQLLYALLVRTVEDIDGFALLELGDEHVVLTYAFCVLARLVVTQTLVLDGLGIHNFQHELTGVLLVSVEVLIFEPL